MGKQRYQLQGGSTYSKKTVPWSRRRTCLSHEHQRPISSGTGDINIPSLDLVLRKLDMMSFFFLGELAEVVFPGAGFSGCYAKEEEVVI